MKKKRSQILKALCAACLATALCAQLSGCKPKSDNTSSKDTISITTTEDDSDTSSSSSSKADSSTASKASSKSSDSSKKSSEKSSSTKAESKASPSSKNESTATSSQKQTSEKNTTTQVESKPQSSTSSENISSELQEYYDLSSSLFNESSEGITLPFVPFDALESYADSSEESPEPSSAPEEKTYSEPTFSLDDNETPILRP